MIITNSTKLYFTIPSDHVSDKELHVYRRAGFPAGREQPAHDRILRVRWVVGIQGLQVNQRRFPILQWKYGKVNYRHRFIVHDLTPNQYEPCNDQYNVLQARGGGSQVGLRLLRLIQPASTRFILDLRICVQVYRIRLPSKNKNRSDLIKNST